MTTLLLLPILVNTGLDRSDVGLTEDYWFVWLAAAKEFLVGEDQAQEIDKYHSCGDSLQDWTQIYLEEPFHKYSQLGVCYTLARPVFCKVDEVYVKVKDVILVYEVIELKNSPVTERSS